jgi:dTDP-4-dehydrorhamnose reductase
VVAFGRDLDVCDGALLETTFAREAPSMVLNCAAFTAVDACEKDADRADRVNHLAAGEIARLCQSFNAILIHLSTDYVFGDGVEAPLTEDAPCDPLNVYGKSKVAGEIAIRAALREHIILRTSWIYGLDAGNFFGTIMSLAQTRDLITVVGDEASCPTFAPDLADAIVGVCHHIAMGSHTY